MQDGEAILVNYKLPGRKVCVLHSYQLFLLHFFSEVLGNLSKDSLGLQRWRETSNDFTNLFLCSGDILTTTIQFSLEKSIYPSIHPSTYSPIHHPVLHMHCALGFPAHLYGKGLSLSQLEQRSQNGRMRVSKRRQQCFFYFIRLSGTLNPI